MADAKYIATAVSFNAKQAEVLSAALSKLEKEVGFALSRSDGICLILARYLQEKQCPTHPS